jgi:hypothetical protein
MSTVVSVKGDVMHPGDMTDVTRSDVMQGPLSSVIQHCLEVLSANDSENCDVVDSNFKHRLNNELVTAYSKLSWSDKQAVDKRLIDILYLLTTRGLDVNAFCDISKRQTPLHVIAALPDSPR